jgi:hypothetical protein
MSTKAGQLLWNRKRIILDAPEVIIDTGLTQVNQAFDSSSTGEPNLGIVIAPPGPADGAGPASRIQVIPLCAISTPSSAFSWEDVTHGEPFVDPATGTVKVAFQNRSEDSFVIKTLNVLFWDPHTAIGPGQADTYHPEPQITE